MLSSPPTGQEPSIPTSPPLYEPSTRPFGVQPIPVEVQTPDQPEQRPAWRALGLVAGIAAISALLISGLIFGTYLLIQDDPEPQISLGASGGGAAGGAGGANLTLQGDALNVQAVLAKVSPSVVTIETNEETLRGVFGGAGSGVLISEDGLILTNSHVIAGADVIEVTFWDGTTVEAIVVGNEPDDDIALIQAEGVVDTLPADLGSSDAMRVGDQVLAIGNALGLGGEPSVTAGIVSAKGREIDAGRVRFRDLIQTDAAINPGNSGGPLVNAAGEVVGINTAIIEGAQNVGFAIAIDSVLPFIEQVAGGDGSVTPETAFFGATTLPLDRVPRSDLSANGVTASRGVYVVDVFGGSAADDAGLTLGDVITSVDGSAVNSPEDLARIIRSFDPGKVISIEYERQGESRTVTANLGTRADAEGD